jgi:hypothetical protein
LAYGGLCLIVLAAVGPLVVRHVQSAPPWHLLEGLGIMFAANMVLMSDGTRAVPGAMWSLRVAGEMFGAIILGPWVMIVPAAAFMGGFAMVRRRPWHLCVFNMMASTSAISAAGAVLSVTGVHGAVRFPIGYVVLPAAALAYVVTDLLCFAASTTTAVTAPMRTFRDEVVGGFNNFVPDTLEALAGTALGVVGVVKPELMPLLMPFALAVYIARRQGMRVQQVTDRALESFANIVDESDRYTFEHSTRVCEYSMLIGDAMGLSEAAMKSLYWTSRLHDLGKVAVDNAILHKPGALTDEEFAEMKRHPVVSARILSAFLFSEYDTDVVLCHHERFDGRGYLARPGDTVPLEAFIIAVADTYDAMTSDRPYRKAMSPTVALDEIQRNIGGQFHPEAAEAFLRAMRSREDALPGGTHVAGHDLAAGETAPEGRSAA